MPVSGPEPTTSVADLPLNMDGVVLVTAVLLVSAPDPVAEEAVLSVSLGEASAVVMTTPVVLVLAILPDVLRAVSISKVGADTLVVEVVVVVVCALSVPPVGSPVNCGMDTHLDRMISTHCMDESFFSPSK